MNAHIEGKLDAATLVQTSRAAFAKFKVNIRSTAPSLLPYLHQNEAQAKMASGRTLQYLRVEDDEEVVVSSSPQYIYLDDVRRRVAE
jgi:hypothetical protein